MSRYPGMAFTPERWVDESLAVFKNPPSGVSEMLESMRGSLIPDEWIDEAAEYLRHKMN